MRDIHQRKMSSFNDEESPGVIFFKLARECLSNDEIISLLRCKIETVVQFLSQKGMNTQSPGDAAILGMLTKMHGAFHPYPRLTASSYVGVSARTKHFERAIHYLRDLTQLRRVLPFHVATNLQRADGYTKSLDKSKYSAWLRTVFPV